MGGLLSLPSLECFCGEAGPEAGGNKQQDGIKQPPSIPLSFPLHSWLQKLGTGCAFPVPGPLSSPGITRTKCGTEKGEESDNQSGNEHRFKKDKVLPFGLVTPQSLLENLSEGKKYKPGNDLILDCYRMGDSRRLR